MIWGPHLREVPVSNQVGLDETTFLLVDATQIVDFHEFVSSTKRMQVPAYSKMGTTTSAPSKHLTDPLSVSQFGV